MIINVEIRDFIRISFFKYHYNLHNFYTKFHNIENYHYLQLSIILTQIFK